MAVAIELTAKRYEDIVANVEITVPLYAFDADTVYVYYGLASLEAVRNVDFTVELAPDQFNTFVLTPTTSLLTKINALIALDPTETNFITVRRSLDYKTATTPDAVRYTPFTSSEFDNIALRFQQVAEQLSRTVTLPLTFVGDEALTLPVPEANRTLAWNAEATGLKNGPTIAEIETVAGLTDQINTLAPIAAQIVGVDLISDEVVIVGNNMGAVVTVANAIAAVNVVAVNVANVEIVANDITAVLLAATNMAAIQAAPQAAIDAVAATEAAEAAAASITLAAVHVGMELPVTSNYIPPGFIRWNEGGTYIRGVWTAFDAWMDANYPSLPVGTLPDMTNHVPRTIGSLAPAVGAKQLDAMQRITGDITRVSLSMGFTAGNGALTGTTNVSTIAGTAGAATGFTTVAFNSGNSPGARVSDDETRVKSFGVRWIIKVANAPIDPGTVDVAALATAVSLIGSRVTALEAIGKPFTKEYVSAQQTITSGGLLSLTHGLGSAPKFVMTELVCTEAGDGEYQIGDRVRVNPSYGSGSASERGTALYTEQTSAATTLYVRYGLNGNVFDVLRKATGAQCVLVNSRWRLIVRAWA